MLIALEDEELVQAGHTAEDMFVHQMKQRRAHLGLSQSELAEKIVALGGNMYQQTIAKLESGQRALRLAEADVIAAALGSTVQDMLASSFSAYAGPAVSGKQPSLDDLWAQQAAVYRRLREASREAMDAHAVLAQAESELARAQEAALHARVTAERATAQQADLAAQYQQLDKRIAEIQATLPDHAGTSPPDKTSAISQPLEGKRAHPPSTPESHEQLKDIGRLLQSARVDAGLTVDELSAMSRIRIAIIHAIEQGDFSPCGGSVYARGHIRAMARAVGLDPSDLVAGYDVAQGEQPVDVPAEAQPRRHRRKRGSAG